MAHILIVDDDDYINKMLDTVLKKENYQVSHAYSGSEALLFLEKNSPDLILLDLMLPGLSGEELLPKITTIPVIVMSAKWDVDHKVELLMAGAVDYVVKPFSTKELLARMAVALRQEKNNNSILQFNNLTLNTDTLAVTVAQTPVKLTRTEYAILKVLMTNPQKVMTKAFLLEKISQDTPDCTENSLKIHVSNLRKKLKEIEGIDYITAVWGIGFKMKTKEDE